MRRFIRDDFLQNQIVYQFDPVECQQCFPVTLFHDPFNEIFTPAVDLFIGEFIFFCQTAENFAGQIFKRVSLNKVFSE